MNLTLCVQHYFMPRLVTQCFAITGFLFLVSGSSTESSLVFLTKSISWAKPPAVLCALLFLYKKQTHRFFLQSAHKTVEPNLRLFLILPCEVVWGTIHNCRAVLHSE